MYGSFPKLINPSVLGWDSNIIKLVVFLVESQIIFAVEELKLRS